MPSNARSVRPTIVLAPSSDLPTSTRYPQGPTQFIKDAPVPMRVLVRNVSFGQTIYIAYDASMLTTQPNDAYQLPAGASDVFVLEQGESLFASASGEAILSYATSVAFPIATVAS